MHLLIFHDTVLLVINRVTSNQIKCLSQTQLRSYNETTWIISHRHHLSWSSILDR